MNLGAGAGLNTEFADFNTFVGLAAGQENNRTRNLNDANYYTGVCLGALAGIREGLYNTTVGYRADIGINLTSGALAALQSTDADRDPYNAVGVGGDSNARYDSNVALGSLAHFEAIESVAIGYNAEVDIGLNHAGGIAIGAFSDVLGTAPNCTVIGYFVQEFSANRTIIGGNPGGSGNTKSIDPAASGTTALGSANYR